MNALGACCAPAVASGKDEKGVGMIFGCRMRHVTARYLPPVQCFDWIS
jgi:hypothetical protein